MQRGHGAFVRVLMVFLFVWNSLLYNKLVEGAIRTLWKTFFTNEKNMFPLPSFIHIGITGENETLPLVT